VSPSIHILSKGLYRSEDLTGKNMFDFYADPESRKTMLQILQKKGRVEDKIRTLNETLETRIAERTKQLEILNKGADFHIKEIEQLTYIASHDLQEPLRTITNLPSLSRKTMQGNWMKTGTNTFCIKLL